MSTRLFAAGLLLAATAAFAQVPAPAAPLLDDAQIATRIAAGQFDQLPDLAAASTRDDPVAMYWWGVLLDACVLDRCRSDEAQALWRRAARAGLSRARVAQYTAVRSATAMDELVADIGPPMNLEEQLAWAATTMALPDAPKPQRLQAADAVRQAARTEPTLLALFLDTGFNGRTDAVDVLRGVVGAGFPSPAAADLLRRVWQAREKKRAPQLLPVAAKGDFITATALCETAAVQDGSDALPEALLPVCTQAFAAGQLGLARPLLAHHLQAGDLSLATAYAEHCMKLPLPCGEPIKRYQREMLGDTPQQQALTAVLALGDGAPATQVQQPPEVMRQGLARRVALAESRRACLLRLKRADGSFADAPGCPWGKPVEGR